MATFCATVWKKLCPVCAHNEQTRLYNERAEAARLLLRKHTSICRCGATMSMTGNSTFADASI